MYVNELNNTEYLLLQMRMIKASYEPVYDEIKKAGEFYVEAIF